MRGLHENPLGVALVGLGGHGRTIQTAAEEAFGVEVLGVFDVNDTLAKEAADRFGCRKAASYEEVIAVAGVEAVVLVTPNTLHRNQADEAFDRGLHVFVEKPIANTTADGVAMVRAAERAGRRLMVGHNMRFGRAPVLAREMVREGRLGEIVTVELHFSADNTHRLDPSAWRLQPFECPLLPVMQLGIHGIDLVHFILNPIVEVSALARSLTTPEGVVDSVSATLLLESGVTGTIVSNYCSQISFEFRIAGTEAALRGTPHRLWIRANAETDGRGDGPAELHDFSQFDQESYRRQLEAFADAIATGEDVRPDGWDGLRSLAVVEAMQRSVDSGQRVSVQYAVAETST